MATMLGIFIIMSCCNTSCKTKYANIVAVHFWENVIK